MTERTKGPAVSMRRPPTRGPQDPWTPRTVSLCGHLFTPYPRRPTLDGPAHEVHLHSIYVCGTPHNAGNPAPCRAANAAKFGLAGFPAPPSLRDTLTPPRRERCFSLYWPSGPTGAPHAAGTPAPCPAAHAAKIGQRAFRRCPACGTPRTLPRPARCFFFIGLAGLTGAVTFRATPHPPPPRTPLFLYRPAGGFTFLYKAPLYKSIFPIS